MLLLQNIIKFDWLQFENKAANGINKRNIEALFDTILKRHKNVNSYPISTFEEDKKPEQYHRFPLTPSKRI